MKLKQRMRLLKINRTRRKSSRSLAGNIFLGIFLSLIAILFIMPILIVVNNAFKPMNEMFMFPPKLFVLHPTLNNFFDLFEMASNTLVPFTRYVFNTVLTVFFGAVGHIVIASMCAFPLAKYKFPGSKFIMNMIIFSLMFSTAVTQVPNFIIISRLHLLNSYGAIIFPAFGYSLGLYLMKNFMEQIPDALLEAAKIDGSSAFDVLWQVVMPLVKPAWVTAFILVFQQLWTNTGSSYIYDESLKGVGYMLSQLASGGITSGVRSGLGVARAGVFSATSLLMFIVPVCVFFITQSNVISTMATSGMKE
ncbi:MAG TPA: carbohydrate ABC transporter permease [Mobilitalea sp.]|nr:carbohydrate ABC transporter permease [Mobilitalea sp.]